MNDEPRQLLWTVKQVAQALGIGERTVWKFSATGEIPAPIRIGRSKRWDRTAIEDWLARKRADSERRRANLPKMA
jgi:excisionase family DNA binding protein